MRIRALSCLMMFFLFISTLVCWYVIFRQKDFVHIVSYYLLFYIIGYFTLKIFSSKIRVYQSSVIFIINNLINIIFSLSHYGDSLISLTISIGYLLFICIILNYLLWLVLKPLHLKIQLVITVFLILNIKIWFAMFISHVDLYGFIKFIQSYIGLNFSNPWSIFEKNGLLSIFPYQTGMLHFISSYAIASSSLWQFSLPNIVSYKQLFAIRIPILVADLMIFKIIINWLINDKKSVLYALILFVSPILFISMYLFGQMDLVIAALFIIFIHLIKTQRVHLAVFVFLLSFIVKPVLLVIALPFLAFFINNWKLFKFDKLLTVGILFLVIYFISNFEFGSSSAYKNLVVDNSPTIRFFTSYYMNLFGNYRIFLSTIIMVVSYLLVLCICNKITQWEDLLYVSSALLLIVPSTTIPSVSWYVWGLAGVLYFYAKQTVKDNYFIFVIYLFFNLVYALFYLIWEYSPFWISFREFDRVFPSFKTAGGSIFNYMNFGADKWNLSNIFLSSLITTAIFIGIHMIGSYLFVNKQIK